MPRKGLLWCCLVLCALQPRAVRPQDAFDLPDISEQVPRLGDDSYRVRALAQRDIIAALRDAIDRNAADFPRVMAAIRGSLRSYQRNAPNLEAETRLGEILRAVERHADSYTCLCSAVCTDGFRIREFVQDAVNDCRGPDETHAAVFPRICSVRGENVRVSSTACRATRNPPSEEELRVQWDGP